MITENSDNFGAFLARSCSTLEDFCPFKIAVWPDTSAITASSGSRQAGQVWRVWRVWQVFFEEKILTRRSAIPLFRGVQERIKCLAIDLAMAACVDG
jgi:hypothetical protein